MSEQAAKTIAEVFPRLKPDNRLAPVLDCMRIERISTNRARTLLRVYITCSRCVHKKHIYALERTIRQQVFSDVPVQVRVIERFDLSALYTPQTLMSEYGDSIELEMEHTSHLMAYLFRSAEFSFPEPGRIDVGIADTMIAHEEENRFYELLERILNERCRMNVQLHLYYLEKEEAEKEQPVEFARIIHGRAVPASGSMVMPGDARDDLTAEGGSAEDLSAMTGEGIPAPGVQGAGASGGENKNTEKENAGAGPAAAAASHRGVRAGRDLAGRKGRRGRKQAGFASAREKDPDMIFGRRFDDEAVPIADLDESSGMTAVRGYILSTESRTLRNERGLIVASITDETDTIKFKLFVEQDEIGTVEGELKKGRCIKLKGRVMLDSFEQDLAIMHVTGIRSIPDFREVRRDNHTSKRVELHCHSKMSDMDGVTDASKLVRRAYEWGHPAIALTDHGGVQAFPEAHHEMEAIDKEYRKKYEKEHPGIDKDELKKISAPFKVIYGMEAYLVDDLKAIVTNSRGQSLQDEYVVFDLETTGLSNLTCKIIEIGAVKVSGGKITDRFSTFVNPEIPIPMRIEQLTSITDAMVVDAPKIEEILPDFLEFCGSAAMVAHNADFDMGFLIRACERMGIEKQFTWLDTIAAARILFPQMSSYKLDKLAKAAGVVLGHHHRAVDDAACTAEIFVRMIGMFEDRGVFDLDQLCELGAGNEESKRKLRSNHAVILAANETGRVNLYRLVSESHLKYFYKGQARLPKSVLQKYREGLIVGSACVKGELYEALLRGAPDSDIAGIVDFYDYLEIQPRGNNLFLIEDEKTESVTCEEDILELNRRIVKLGEQFGKPVAATCDVHFMDPKDEIYRRIIMASRKFKDADEQSPLYLHTTEEMLDEFSYLGSRKAEEVVITNPQKIAGMVEKISPIRAGKFPPVIENSDQTLREICYRRAHEIYGEELPELVEARLERELNSIISNGYAVMYIIAQKLVWKSNEDGYLVGSRGSVGSSFVATMSGITEVNPLPPHYLCPKCRYVDFDSEAVTGYRDMGKAGCDMPDAVCPKCGEKLQKLGFNIPFETFLGFKGNKEPDIDLNFSGEYQSKAHKYTEVIFGDGQTFRAGTIGTMADKTAFGFVKNYYKERGIVKRTCEIERLVGGCVGIRRTTGQHPGGIIVLPIGEDINAFTPVQHPADDITSDIVTTHFDYHSIDSNLLKLDILGHDDPTMIRMLMDLTGIDATTIPLDEPKVMSLFGGTSALGITPDDIGGCPLGCLGVPEFGTDFVIKMLMDTKPQCFSDLIRISGLSHGTDVWLGNAQKLIQEKKATISTAICTRDDIMTYLIAKGLESEQSFTIMESVRKGKGLKPEWEKEMKAHDVPDWYIWSCKTIKYMFPKAHAVAYVMMAYRIAWYKIYYPLAYYAAYFSIRASAFSYEKMCMGRERLEEYMRDFEAHRDTATNQEQEAYKDMKIVQEMYARGFSFVPIDLYKVQAHRFQIIDGALMPSLDAIEGLGEKAAESIELAARAGEFLSKDDFRMRAKVGRSITDTMERLGIMTDLPETNQISLFDFQKGVL